MREEKDSVNREGAAASMNDTLKVLLISICALYCHSFYCSKSANSAGSDYKCSLSARWLFRCKLQMLISYNIDFTLLQVALAITTAVLAFLTSTTGLS